MTLNPYFNTVNGLTTYTAPLAAVSGGGAGSIGGGLGGAGGGGGRVERRAAVVWAVSLAAAVSPGWAVRSPV